MTISECVYSNKVIPHYKYTDEYINFIIEKSLYDIKVGSDQDLINIVLKYFDDGCIKISLLKSKFPKIFGEKNKGKYYLNEQIVSNIQKYFSIKEKINDISNLELYLLSGSLYLNIDSFEKFENSLIIYQTLKSKCDNIDKNELSIRVYNYIKNFNKNSKLLQNAISNVKNNYLTLSIYDIFKISDIEKKVFIKNNINTLEEFLSLGIYNLMYICSSDLDGYINELKSLSVGIKNIIEESFSIFEEKSLEILLKRNGYLDEHKYTLEEIGTALNVTRERVRQVEAKAIKKIKLLAQKNFTILTAFYNSELGKRKPYITLDKITNKYETTFVNKLLLLFEYGNLSLCYDSKYQIIYNKELNDINIMIGDVINKIGIVAEPAEVEKGDLFNLNVVKNNYKKITSELYLKNGCMYRELFLDLIVELFPKGFRPGNDNDYNEFVKAVNERYKIYEDIPSKHSLEAMIGRSDFIQSDRGEYISGKYAVSLEKDMVDKILSYISENEFTYYNAIFEKFSGELKKVGIKNRYYLKGCIDKFLPDDMSKKRDYIVCGDTDKTPYDNFINQMHSYPGRFTKNDLKKVFVGVKDYTIYNFLYSEIDKGLIWISTSEFIYSEKYNISAETKTELKEFIDKLFISMNTDLLTSKKIYAKLQFTNKELFNKLNLSNGHFELFSIIKSFYDDYYYSRPYIFLNESAFNTRSTIIQNYVRQFDSFNFKLIQDYQSKLNIGNLYSYLEFMESMSDEYVQVDLDEMVKTEKMNLDEIKINEIKKSIDLILDNFEVLDTSKFNGYSLLPKISYVWNKYLLIGIIRSYLSEFYDIKNTDSTYTKTDFEVRRVKYE